MASEQINVGLEQAAADEAAVAWFERRARPVTDPRAKRAAAVAASQDFPILPTAGDDAAPRLEADENDNLTPAQRLAVAAIVCGATFSAAAGAAGVSRRTLFEWRQQPAFRDAVEARSREALDVAVVRVRNLMLRATRVIGESMRDDPHCGPNTALRVLNSARAWSVLERGSATAVNASGVSS